MGGWLAGWLAGWAGGRERAGGRAGGWVSLGTHHKRTCRVVVRAETMATPEPSNPDP